MNDRGKQALTANRVPNLFMRAWNSSHAWIDELRSQIVAMGNGQLRASGHGMHAPSGQIVPYADGAFDARVAAAMAALQPRQSDADTSEVRIQEALCLWLLAYFVGEPDPSLDYAIAWWIDDSGGATAWSLRMKMYGDVFRHERKRQADADRLGLLRPAGILQVADRSTLLDPKEHLRLERDNVRRLQDSWGIEPDALLTKIQEIYSEGTPSPSEHGTIGLVTERLARLYCAAQVLLYQKSRYPYRILARASAQTDGLTAEAVRSAALVHRQVNPHFECQWVEETSLPVCVLSSRVGVQRNLGQSMIGTTRIASPRALDELRVLVARELDNAKQE